MANALDLILSSIKRKLKYHTGDSGAAWDSLVESLQNPVPIGTASQLERGAAMRMQPGSLRPNLTNQEMVNAGLNIAGVAPVGMFIGKGAKVWDVVKSAQAQKMADAGVDPRKIWAETGNWKAPDGMWRQEIPDNAAAINANKGRYLNISPEANEAGFYHTMPVTDFLRHPELRSSYPDITNTNLTLKSYGKGGGGAYIYGGVANDSITLDNAFAKSPMIKAVDGPFTISEADAAKINSAELALGNYRLTNQNEAKSSTLHELQHAIQQREGWARGGSPDMFAGDKANEALKELTARQTRGLEPFSPEAQAIRDRLFDNLAKDDAIGYPQKLYRRLAGEAEARATQARMNMDMPQRQQTYPADSYDVPLDQLLVRYGDGPAMSTVRPTNSLDGLQKQEFIDQYISRLREISPQQPERWYQKQAEMNYETSKARLATSRHTNAQGQPIPPTKYELAHAEAQRVAALPVEQGGLGLPANNTAMDRAAAMGAENKIPIESLRNSYEMGIKGIDGLSGEELNRVSNFGPMNRLAFNSGIRADDFPMMETGYRYGKAPQSGVSKNYADNTYEPGVSMAAVGDDNSWLGNSIFFRDRDIHEYQGLHNPNIRGSDGEPLLSGVKEINIDKPTVGEENAINLLYSLPERGAYPNPDNAKMRSRFAAFNPANRDSADLLASLGLPVASASALLSLIYGQEDAQASELQRMAR